jgi:hypothetical protein
MLDSASAFLTLNRATSAPEQAASANPQLLGD